MKYDTIFSLPKAARLEQLAEEATELAQAALKLARKLRGENPTPADEQALMAALSEEFTDVRLCADVAGVEIDKRMYNFKLN